MKMKTKMNRSIKFSLTIAVITFVLAAIFSIISTSALSNVTWISGLVIVLLIVLIGIVFDMLGTASTAAKKAPINAMAAEKVMSAREAFVIVKNADKFASFCNDVVGDISGIVSGTATVVVVLHVLTLLGHKEVTQTQITLSVLLTSFFATFKYGGKV